MELTLSTKEVTKVMQIHVTSRISALLSHFLQNRPISAKTTAERNLLYMSYSHSSEAKQRKSIHVKGPAVIIKTGIPCTHRSHLSWQGNPVVCMQ